jgi:DNA (cytosine-5)-methyltransferase 1
MPERRINAVDLFCGAGGFSTGLIEAATEMGLDVDLVAVNHWDVAISTHQQNHPEVSHLCTGIDALDPNKVVPSGKLNLLLASPECTHHSNARGGKPMSDQSRASAWHICFWAERLDIDHIIVENVPEFESWGPLYTEGHAQEFRPVPQKRGAYFQNFLRNLRTLGYKVEYRVLNAAHYGEATSRRRLFIQAKKTRGRIAWPEISHVSAASIKTDDLGLFPEAKPFRTAREIIDWDNKGRSIYGRKKALSENTLRRIYAGLRKFSGLPFVLPHQHGASGDNVRSVDQPLPTVTGTSSDMFLAQPFLIILRRNCDALPVDGPLPCLTAKGTHVGVAEPFLVPFFGERGGQSPRTHSLDDPLPVVTSHGAGGLVQPEIHPFIVGAGGCQGNGKPESIDEPLNTVLSESHLALVEPFVLQIAHGLRCHSVDDPLPTITGTNEYAVAEPCLVNMKGRSDAADIDCPVPTITAHAQHIGVVQPFILKQYKTTRPYSSTDEPLPTVTAQFEHLGLVEPYIVEYHGSGAGKERVRPVDDPLPAQDTSNRFGLAQPVIVKYHGNEKGAHSVDEPLPTVTTKDRCGVAEPCIAPALKEQVRLLAEAGYLEKGDVVGVLDIRFRMLTPRELARAMGFSEDYKFSGNRADEVKQIGNAVSVRKAKALCKAAIQGLPISKVKAR